MWTDRIEKIPDNPINQKHNCYTYPLCQGNERTEHPTQKPLNLIKDILQYHTNKNDLVLDMFVGSGTILVACKELSKNAIGIELEKKYCDIAVNRIKNTQELMFNA